MSIPTNKKIKQVTYNGTNVPLGDNNLVPENIKKNVSILGVTGNYEGSGQAYSENSFLQGIAVGKAMKGVSVVGSSAPAAEDGIWAHLTTELTDDDGYIWAGDPEELYDDAKYLESSGHQYINTDYYFGDNSRIDVDAMCTDNRTDDRWLQITGARSSYRASSAIQIAFNSNSNYCATDIGTGTGGTTLSKNTRFSVSVTTTGATINGIPQTMEGTFSGTSPYPLWIFDDNDAGSHEQYFIGNVYFYKIYDSNVQSRNLIPKVRKRDNKPGLYDTITGAFLTNSGSGEFGYELLDGTYVAPV